MKCGTLVTTVWLALVVALAGVARAATIRVPLDYPTIQQAVDAAADGDTIEVAPGTYLVTQILIQNKSLTVRGEDRETTIIDGQQTAELPLPGTLRISNPSGPVVVDGFTIREAGTGILGDAALVVPVALQHPVTIRNCHLIGLSNGEDSGVWVYDTTTGGTITVENCEFESMHIAILLERPIGGGTIINNDIHGLVPTPGDPLYEAVGIFAFTYGAVDGDISSLIAVNSNTFSDYAGTCITFGGGYPGETMRKFTNVEAKNNIVNAIGAGPERRHEGIVLTNYGTTPDEAAQGGVDNAVICGNMITGTGGTDSRGIRIWGPCNNPTITGTVITNLYRGIAVEEKYVGAGFATGVVAHSNSIVGNTVGIDNGSPTSTLDAENNWWNAVDGPGPPGGIGSGDPVSTMVDFTPWLTHPAGEVTVSLQLEGIVPAPRTRNIEFVVSALGDVPFVIQTKSVAFANGLGTTTLLVPAGCATWTCLSAKDAQHTLYGTVTLVDTGGMQYVANLTGANKLLGGDLNNDNVCDVWDYGIMVSQYGAPPPPTGFNADIDLDGRVWKADLRLLYSHYLNRGNPPCGTNYASLPTPVSRITVTQLAALVGLANARKADMDRNGIINTTDVRIYYLRNACVR